MLQFNPRIEERTRLLLRARLRGGGLDRDICILDASTRGFLATTANPPRRGDIVEIAIGAHRLNGLVKWSAARRFGVVLHERISVIALASGDAEILRLDDREARQARRTRRDNAAAPGVLAQRLQFALLAGAGLAGAWLLMDLAGEGLSPLDDARQAMASRD